MAPRCWERAPSTTSDSTDPVSQARNAAFLQGLQELGWIIGRNVEIEYRWAPGGVDNVDNSRRNAEELVALAPDVNPGHRRYQHGAAATGNPHRADRVRAGYRPGRRRLCRKPRPAGRQVTGFIPFEFGISGKWLELLKEIAPGVRRVACFAMRRSPWASGSWVRPIGGAVARCGVEPGRHRAMLTRSSAPSPLSLATQTAG